MHRALVLKLLTQHAVQLRDHHEAAMTAATIRFVESCPNCLLRSQLDGHLTGSAWIVDPCRKKTLLTHHKKLDKWVQLGGHADGDTSLWKVARREAEEESGLKTLVSASSAIFDVDRHYIAASRDLPGHFHYDLRFLFEADACEPLVISSESKDLAWVPLECVADLNAEESMGRMVRKTQLL